MTLLDGFGAYMGSFKFQGLAILCRHFAAVIVGDFVLK